ncbi:ATP-binding cassette domain-containing protein [bacterium]|nr:ATP-binding cassette domain-containing protein [bacterium]
MLQVSHLHKEFSSVTAVDDVSFEVRPGQIFGLIGPNGAGKSTTIRMIMDIIQPDRGQVLLDGTVMREEMKNMVGYLPEERGLYRKNKLLNVISYFGSLKGMSQAEAREAARPMLEHFSLLPYEKRNVEELSKGNQQKVQFIISILHQPRLLVLDELFAGLDPVNQELMKEALLKLREENRAIIFSTHQMEQAEKLCDELLMINHGTTVLHGTPAEIKRVHGRNAVHVEYTGDAGVLQQLDGVRITDRARNYAELELDEGVRTNDIISALLPHADIHRIARIEPSLHAIFLQVAAQQDDPVRPASDTHVPPPPRLKTKEPRVRRQFLNMLIFLTVAVVIMLDFRNGFEPMKGVFVLLAVAAAGYSFIRFQRFKKEAEQGGNGDRQEDGK